MHKVKICPFSDNKVEKRVRSAFSACRKLFCILKLYCITDHPPVHHRLIVFCLVCFCPVVGGFQPQDQVMPTAGGHEESSPGTGFGQSGQSFYNSRGVPRGGPRNARGMMNGYRGSSNGFRGTGIKLCFTEIQ